MKFSIQRNDFAAGMTLVSRIVSKKTSAFPILGNVLLTARSGLLELKASDLDVEMTTKVPAEIEVPGKTTVPANMLTGILAKLQKDGLVTFALEAKELSASINSGRSRFKLTVMDSDAFPNIVGGPFPGSFKITGKALADVLGRVEFAISTEETRYYLNGVFVQPMAGGIINFVSTDGHRLAKVKREIAMAGNFPPIIVPRRTVAELLHLGELAGDGEILVEINDTKIRATSGGMMVLSKLIEGTFPDYERVTPKDGNLSATVDVKALLTAAGRVGVLSNDRGGKAVKMTFAPKLLTLEVVAPDHGMATDEVEIDYDADPIPIGFNVDYLTEALRAFGTGNVTFKMTNEGSPALVTSDTDAGMSVVMMPMRVG